MVGQGGVVECDIKRRPVDPRACSPPHWVRGQRGTGRGGPKGRLFPDASQILVVLNTTRVGKGLCIGYFYGGTWLLLLYSLRALISHLGFLVPLYALVIVVHLVHSRCITIALQLYLEAWITVTGAGAIVLYKCVWMCWWLEFLYETWYP